jgi:hypothetical protein
MTPNPPKTVTTFIRIRATKLNDASRRHPQTAEAIQGKRPDEFDVALTMARGPKEIPGTKSSADKKNDTVVQKCPVESPKSYCHDR